MDKTLEKVMTAVAANNMQPFYVETKAEIVPLIAELLNDGDTVAVGGSQTLFESGVIEHLRSGRYNFADRYAEGLTDEQLHEVFMESLHVDAYLSSANAVTEAGELYNVDGRSNRVAALAYGPKSVIVVVGKNKIVPDLEHAVLRVKTIAAPKNCRRVGADTYCKHNGQCMSVAQNRNDSMVAGCDGPARICCNYLVSAMQRTKNRIKVIFVGEELGY